MARYECSACEKSFEADEARCPECLKKTSVSPKGQAPQGGRPSPIRRSLFAGPGILVTLAIMVPFSFYVPQQNYVTTFIAAVIAFGLGHITNRFYRRWRAR